MSHGRGITGRWRKPDSSVSTEILATDRLTVDYGWVACESCGAWVGTELIGPDGAGCTADDAFNCSSCRWGDDEEIWT